MKTLLRILFFFILISAMQSCTDTVDLSQEYFTAIISDYDLNRNTCIVTVLDKNVEKLLGKSTNNQYNAVNLPKNDENILGKLIKIKVRLATENEISAGVALYAANSYPNIYVVDCQDYSFNYKDTIQLPVNNLIQSYDNKYVISFDSVFTDSRCPLNAECVWAGVAGVRFTVTAKDASSKTFELYTINNNQWSDSLNYNGLSVKLLEVTPYPELNKELDYKSYKAKIKISKIN